MSRGRLQRFRRLEARERRRAVRALAAVGVCELALRVVSFKIILRALQWRADHAAPVDSDVAAVTHWIERVDPLVPGERSCLRRALSAYWLLGGAPGVELRLSARPERGRLHGHAWVREGSRDVMRAGRFGRVKPLLAVAASSSRETLKGSRLRAGSRLNTSAV
ncbi:MAG: lasso peptide biosynthesis B2 protein [Nitrospirae bacterium]|nr:lasso peptide biosynthesis B2 protein [Nitrospirota bacterium]